jgi:hypothetical protein
VVAIFDRGHAEPKQEVPRRLHDEHDHCEQGNPLIIVVVQRNVGVNLEEESQGELGHDIPHQRRRIAYDGMVLHRRTRRSTGYREAPPGVELRGGESAARNEVGRAPPGMGR